MFITKNFHSTDTKTQMNIEKVIKPRANYQRIDPRTRLEIKLSQTQRDVLIGNMLGDATAIRTNIRSNTRIKFEQTYPKNEEYILHIYEIFSNLTTNLGPRLGVLPDKRTKFIEIFLL